jgi:hypothetical protein
MELEDLISGKTTVSFRSYCTDSLVEISSKLANELRKTGNRKRIIAITSLQVRVAKVLKTRVGHVVDGENAE